jgi:Polyketide cyclase / dehydrase and lipid transport
MSKTARAAPGRLCGMATVRKEVIIDTPPQAAWDALRDWGAPHERLVRGFVTATTLDGDDRLVTFFNGAVVRERLVSCDDETRRLVWSIADGPYTHHNGAAQVFDHGAGQTRFVWTADLLPNELAGHIEGLMERGIAVVKETLQESAP